MRGLLCLGLALILPSEAIAQRDREQSPQLFMANSGPRVEKSYYEGQDILRVPIVWHRAAVLRAKVILQAGDRADILLSGTALPEERLLEAKKSKTFFTAYCTPREARERSFDGMTGTGPLLAALITKNTTDAQFCLADRDGDGRFEQSLLVGAGWGSARKPRAITPVPYEVRNDVPISPDDEVRINFFASDRAGPRMVLEIHQQGAPRVFDYISASGRFTVANRENRLDLSGSFPQRFAIFGAEFEITGYDREAKKVTVRWPEDAEADRRLAIPDGISYSYW
jgi:hypothetical protein